MSPELLNLIAELVTLASTQGVDNQELSNAISTALGTTPSPPANIWNSDGVSKPDNRGFIRYKRIDEFCDQLIAAGHADIVKQAFSSGGWYASRSGLAQLQTGSDLWQEIITDMSWAGFSTFAPQLMSGKCFKFHRIQDDFGTHLVQLPNPDSQSAPYQYYEDAMALPNTLKTVIEQEGFLIGNAKRLLEDQKHPDPPGVDFSPMKS